MTRPPNPDLPKKILDATEELVAAHGTEGLNMRKLARRVGITATTIYHYFKDKEALIHELRLRIAEKLNTQIRAMDPTLSPHETIHELGRIYVAFAEDHPRLYKVYVEELVGHSDIPEEDRKVLFYTYYVARNNLERMVGEGHPCPADAKSMALMGWIMLHGFSSLLIGGRLEMAEDLDKETLKALFLSFYTGGKPQMA
jgi:AcrR family transcriptional regulator